MAYPDDLIEQAKALAAADPRRPKQANLRRAVSAAYYALFHEIVDRAASSVLSNTDASGLIGDRLRRVVSHRSVLNAAKWFSGAPADMPTAIKAMRTSAGAAIPAIAAPFDRACKLLRRLQEERHRADYDVSAPFTRAETGRRIADAEAAIHTLRNTRSEGDALIFFLGCVLGDALTKNQ